MASNIQKIKVTLVSFEYASSRKTEQEDCTRLFTRSWWGLFLDDVSNRFQKLMIFVSCFTLYDQYCRILANLSAVERATRIVLSIIIYVKFILISFQKSKKQSTYYDNFFLLPV